MGDDLKVLTPISNNVQPIVDQAQAKVDEAQKNAVPPTSQPQQITVYPDSWAAVTDGGEDSKPYTITVPPSQELQKITAEVKNNGVDLKDLCDENGTLKGENLLKAKDRIKVEAQKLEATNALGAARLYDQMTHLDPNDKVAHFAAAHSYKSAADQTGDPQIKKLHYQQVKTHLDSGGIFKLGYPDPLSFPLYEEALKESLKAEPLDSVRKSFLEKWNQLKKNLKENPAGATQLAVELKVYGEILRNSPEGDPSKKFEDLKSLKELNKDLANFVNAKKEFKEYFHLRDNEFWYLDKDIKQLRDQLASSLALPDGTQTTPDQLKNARLCAEMSFEVRTSSSIGDSKTLLEDLKRWAAFLKATPPSQISASERFDQLGQLGKMVVVIRDQNREGNPNGQDELNRPYDPLINAINDELLHYADEIKVEGAKDAISYLFNKDAR
jgi:hypothetical protein